MSLRILTTRLDQIPNKVSVYAPKDNKSKQERKSFYDQLQDTIQSLPQDQPLITLGGLVTMQYLELNKGLTNAC